jgi:hypothetical protein
MPAKCEKSGCEEEGANKVRFCDLFLRTDTGYPIVLCEGHTEEAGKFGPTDVPGLKKWLDS